MAHNDEDDIIGDRPKRKPAADLGPLFSDLESLMFHEVTAEEAQALEAESMKPDASGTDAGSRAENFDGLALLNRPLGPADRIVVVHGGRILADEEQEDDDAWEPSRDPGDKVWDAAEPEPEEPAAAPTKAERLEAIERLKHKARARVISLAESTIGAPEPLAGVTAADAYVIMSGEPEAALLGRESRAWSWLGPWLAQLAREGALRVYRVKGHPVRRHAKRKQSHGNAHVVYLHPRDPLGFPVE